MALCLLTPQLKTKPNKAFNFKTSSCIEKKKTRLSLYALFENSTTRLQVQLYLEIFHHTSIDTLNYDFFFIQGQDEILDSNKKEELRVKSQS